MNYWVVGATQSGKDLSQEFLDKNIWKDGYAGDGDDGDDQNKKSLDEVAIGDIFLMKSSATKGENHSVSFTRLKAVGEVVSKREYYYFNVKWFKIKELPKDFDGISYRTTIEKFRGQKEMLEFVQGIVEKETGIDLIKYKKQIILQGPPGTGKTYKAKKIAKTLTGEKQSGKKWKIIQFHPSYTYEDFVRGIVAKTDNNQMIYETQNKVLIDFVKKAKEAENDDHVLIIDEINRANLPVVLGELIYALEYRGESVDSMYKHEQDGNAITLPDNLYIIGTMNTADRSVGHIDYAIRRRFAFVDVKPDESFVDNTAKDLFKKVEELFEEFISPEFSKDDVMIGHSYFMQKGSKAKNWLNLSLEYEIKPILKEYVKDGILLEGASKKIEELNV